MYEVEKYVANFVKVLYEDCRSCVRVDREVGENFEVKGIWVCDMISLWLFNVFVKKMVKGVIKKVWPIRRRDKETSKRRHC